MNWLTDIVRPKIKKTTPKEIAHDLWVKCSECGQMLFSKELKQSMYVCTKCGHHLRLYVDKRLKQLFDDGIYREMQLPSVKEDPLKFKDTQRYVDRLRIYRKKTGNNDAIKVGTGKVAGIDTVVAAMDFSFMGGSMGTAVGEGIVAAAQYASRGGLSAAVLESAAIGGQVMQIMDLENYPGIFPQVNGIEFINNMKNQAEAFGAKFFSVNVSSIDKQGDFFIVKTKDKVFKSYALLIATGAIHRNLEVKGEKEFSGRGVSYCAVCDGPFFKNKNIYVVGGGDSACSEAIYLSSLSPNVSIIHRRDSFRAQKAVVDKMLSCGVKPIYDSVVKEIKGSVKVESIVLQNVKTNEETELSADAIFIFTGMIPQTALVEMLPKDEGGYIVTNEQMQTVIPGLYAAGDVRSKSFRQVVTATSDGAIAAHSAKEFVDSVKDGKK